MDYLAARPDSERVMPLKAKLAGNYAPAERIANPCLPPPGNTIVGIRLTIVNTARASSEVADLVAILVVTWFYFPAFDIF